MFSLKLELNAEESEEKCTGLVFRGVSTVYSGKYCTYAERTELRLLRRKSCQCDGCSQLLSDIEQCVYDGRVDHPPIEHGEMYSVRYCNISRDWESGWIDDWDIEFYKIETAL